MSDKISIKDLRSHVLCEHIKTIDDVKNYLECVIQEDETAEDILFSISGLIVALERMK